MKKILMSSLMVIILGNIAFGNDMAEKETTPLPRHLHKMQRTSYCKRDPELERIRIMIDEKRLDIRKELLNEKPDWNKIEKLNIEIATQDAKLKTCRMRESYEREYLKSNKQ